MSWKLKTGKSTEERQQANQQIRETVEQILADMKNAEIKPFANYPLNSIVMTVRIIV